MPYLSQGSVRLTKAQDKVECGYRAAVASI